MKITTATAMTMATTAKARPRSSPLIAAGRAAAGAGREGAATGAGAAGLAGREAADGAAGGAGAAAGAAGTAVWAEPTGALGEGILIDGPPAGFGGRLMRTVCFFCVASAALGGSGAGVGAGGTGGVGSDIKEYCLPDAKDAHGASQTVYRRERRGVGLRTANSEQRATGVKHANAGRYAVPCSSFAVSQPRCSLFTVRRFSARLPALYGQNRTTFRRTGRSGRRHGQGSRRRLSDRQGAI